MAIFILFEKEMCKIDIHFDLKNQSLTDPHTATYAPHMRKPIREYLAGQRFINRPITSVL